MSVGNDTKDLDDQHNLMRALTDFNLNHYFKQKKGLAVLIRASPQFYFFLAIFGIFF